MALVKFKEAVRRIFSGIIIGVLFIGSILFYPKAFCGLIAVITFFMLYEWYKMTQTSLPFILLGLLVIPLPMYLLIRIAYDPSNKWLILIYFTIIWSVDTFAMVGGKTIGGPKLAPSLSPNKTWSGFITGVLSACIISTILSQIISNYSLSHVALCSIMLGSVAQCSDLFISFFKRRFGIKDSGNIIPGHGGVLDRFDSLILTTPILLWIYQYNIVSAHIT